MNNPPIPKLRYVQPGLCGNFNGILADEQRSWAGVVEATIPAFANSWKAQPNCLDVTTSIQDACSVTAQTGESSPRVPFRPSTVHHYHPLTGIILRSIWKFLSGWTLAHQGHVSCSCVCREHVWFPEEGRWAICCLP